MVKIERSPAPAALGTDYRAPGVVSQLAKDFYEKCYLCEIKPLQDIHVEHLHPHGGKDQMRKLDWNNMFLSCPHCNLVKKRKEYCDMILDCCETDPEKALNQQLKDGHVLVEPLNDAPETVKTAQLLTECFELKNTDYRVIACQTRVNELSLTMDTLYKTLQEYRENPSGNSLRRLRGMLSRTYKFAGFTRTYVRNHLGDYPELADYVGL